MVSNDIYNNKARYDNFKDRIDLLSKLPDKKSKKGGTRKFICRNTSNLQYFKDLCIKFESQDISYIRRLRYLRTLLLITHYTDKDLKSLERKDIDGIMANMHNHYKTPVSKADFVKNIKRIWRILFPEKDERGRIDESICPYVVRHLTRKQEKSKERRRNDKLTFEEFEKLINYFSNDARIQFYIMFAVESLARPQELLYLKIKDIEIYDNYAKIWISSHGKEGTGLLQCIDSFPYLVRWLEKHPFKNNKDSFLIINKGSANYGKQITPEVITHKLKKACKKIGIEKDATAYSLKRIGVTFKRLRGYSDVEIQHTARWTSTAQLKTYDQSEQEDTFKLQLIKRGIIQDEKYKELEPKTKECLFCNKLNGFNEELCSNCKRPLNREKIKQEFEAHTRGMTLMQDQLKEMKDRMQEQERISNIFKGLASISPEAISKIAETIEKLDEKIKD